MKYIRLLVVIAIVHWSWAIRGQQLDGQVIDSETKEYLIGAYLRCNTETGSKIITSDKSGNFTLQNVREVEEVTISYLGYQSVTYSKDYLLNLTSPFIVELEAQDYTFEEAEISAYHPYRGSKVLFSKKEFQVLPGAYEDPSRLTIKSPAISTGNDQANGILYRGLPSMMTGWTINGAPVTNPNHLSNAGTLSDASSPSAGGTHMISSNMIGQYNFASAPYQNVYGNALAGVSNVELTDQPKNYINLSLVGMEGGLHFQNKNIPGVQLNYRYSTVGILTGPLGLDFGGEVIQFQDVVAKVDLIKTSDSKLSVFGIYGNSSNDHARIDSLTKTGTFKDFQDISYRSNALISGANYSRKYDHQEIKASLNYSTKVDDREASSPLLLYSSDFLLESDLVSGLFLWNFTKNKAKYEVGLTGHYSSDNRSSQIVNFLEQANTFRNSNIRPYLSYSWMQNNLIAEGSLALNYNSHTSRALIEPFLSARYLINDAMKLELSYRKNSQLLSTALFSYEYDAAEIIGHNIEATWTYSRPIFSFFVNPFYHTFSNILVEEGSNYSQFTSLDTEVVGAYNFGGKAYSRGVALGMGLENIANDRIHFTANYSIFDAQYSNSEGDYFENTFDFDQSANVILTFDQPLRKERKLTVSAAYHYRGGLKEFPIDESLSLSRLQTQYLFRSSPMQGLSPFTRVDFRIVYSAVKSDRRKRAHFISLDIQNILNRENDAFTAIDLFRGNQFIQKQLGMVPILAYRMEF